LQETQKNELECALVTMTKLEGTGPRPVGAHMAISATGKRVGYVTSGCLEEAITQDALAAIRSKTNKIVTYGENSQFLDFRLPCGGSMTFYIHVNPDRDLITRCAHLLEQRKPYTLAFDPEQGTIAFKDDVEESSYSEDSILARPYRPSPRFLLIGIGTELETMARVTTAAGYETEVISPDDGLQGDCAALGVPFHLLSNAQSISAIPQDPWTAIVFLFHDLDRERPLLQSTLDGPAYYIGALGSRRTHEMRLKQLRETGLTEETLARIHGPIGLIPAARDPAVLAISTIAEAIECFRKAAPKQ